MLPPDLEALWQHYLNEEKHGVRKRALSLLDRFIAALLIQPPSLWGAWAMQITATIVDDSGDVPVRFPFFRRVLLPLLVEGVNNQRPSCARWLAAFVPMLHHSLPTGLPPELESRVGLLREALRIKPNDSQALEQIIVSEASSLGYSLHELPSGVLYGLNGATPEQCDALLDQLYEFEMDLHRSGESDRYQELVNACRFHYQTYRQYLTTHHESMSYERYLQLGSLESKENT